MQSDIMRLTIRPDNAEPTKLGRTLTGGRHIWQKHDLADHAAFAEKLMSLLCLRERHPEGDEGLVRPNVRANRRLNSL